MSVLKRTRPVECQKRPTYIKKRLNYMWIKENPACIWKKERKTCMWMITKTCSASKETYTYQKEISININSKSHIIESLFDIYRSLLALSKRDIKKRSRHTLIQNQHTHLCKKKKRPTYVWANAPCIVSKETYIYQK